MSDGCRGGLPDESAHRVSGPDRSGRGVDGVLGSRPRVHAPYGALRTTRKIRDAITPHSARRIRVRRDRAVRTHAALASLSRVTRGEDGCPAHDGYRHRYAMEPVSYTHLTLPTIYSV